MTVDLQTAFTIASFIAAAISMLVASVVWFSAQQGKTREIRSEEGMQLRELMQRELTRLSSENETLRQQVYEGQQKSLQDERKISRLETELTNARQEIAIIRSDLGMAREDITRLRRSLRDAVEGKE